MAKKRKPTTTEHTGRKAHNPKRDADEMRLFMNTLRGSECLTISAACKKVGIRRDTRLRYLRAKYHDFDMEIKQVMGTGGVDRKNPVIVQNEFGYDFSRTDPRLNHFLISYRETQSRATACRKAGMLPSTLKKLVDPEDDKYNPEFARALREEELMAMLEIEDGAKREARLGDGTMQRFILERRNPEYGQKAGSMTQENVQQYSAEGFEKAVEFLAEAIKKIKESETSSDSGILPMAADYSAAADVDEEGVN